MSAEAFFGNMPYLATMPSCLLYLRTTNGAFRDWSPVHATISIGGSPANSTVQSKFPPGSIYIPANTAWLSVGTVPNMSAGPWVLSAWVWIDGNPVGDNINILRCGPTSGISRWIWDMWPQGGAGTLRIVNQNNEVLWNSSNINMIASVWNHVAAINDGTTVYFYLNGAQIGSHAAFTLTTYSSFSVAQQSTVNTSIPTYYIDECGIWGGSSSAVVPKISDLYTSTRPYPRRLIVG